jgi:hypothetical protein
MLTKEKFIHYDVKTIVSTNPGAVSLPEWVNGVTVENSGNTNLYWDSDLILPGDFKAIGGNYGEIFVGDVTLKWAVPTPAPTDPQNMATVSVKFYVKYNP